MLNHGQGQKQNYCKCNTNEILGKLSGVKLNSGEVRFRSVYLIAHHHYVAHWDKSSKMSPQQFRNIKLQYEKILADFIFPWFHLYYVWFILKYFTLSFSSVFRYLKMDGELFGIFSQCAVVKLVSLSVPIVADKHVVFAMFELCYIFLGGPPIWKKRVNRSAFGICVKKKS